MGDTEAISHNSKSWKQRAALASIPESKEEWFRDRVIHLFANVGKIRTALRHCPSGKVARPFQRIAKLAGNLENALAEIEKAFVGISKADDVNIIEARRDHLEWQLIKAADAAARPLESAPYASDFINLKRQQAAELRLIAARTAAEAIANLPARGRPKGSEHNADIFIGRLASIVFRAGGNVTPGETGSLMTLLDDLRGNLPDDFLPEGWVSTYQGVIASAKKQSDSVIKKRKRAPH